MKPKTACLILIPALVATCIALDPPMPLFPESGTKGAPPKVELIVACPVGADELHFQVFAASDDAAGPYVETYTTEPAWLAPGGRGLDPTPTLFKLGETYFWTCRARYGEEWSEFFAPRWSFEVVKLDPPVDARSYAAGSLADPRRPAQPPAPPVPIAPEPGAKSMFTKVELVVACPTEYDELHYVVYELTGDISKPLAEKYTKDPSALAPFGNGFDRNPIYFKVGCSYLWSCRVRHGDEWSEFFEPMWGFVVTGPDPDAGMRPPPAPPVPIAPERGSKMRGGAVTLVTKAPAATELFHFIVYRLGDGLGQPELAWEDYVSENFWRIPAMLPVIFGTYEWSCRLFDGELWSAWFSPAWTFELEKVPETGSAGKTGATPLRPQVAPNPCGPSGAVIRLGAALTKPAVAEVYDVAGNLVRTVVAARGEASLRWDGKDQTGRKVGAGTYLCRVRTDDERHVVRITKSR